MQKTIYEYKRALGNLAAFLGHDDASHLSSQTLVAWKAKMIAAGLQPKTIRSAKLAPVRAILQWAVDNNRLPVNPAARVTLGLKTQAANRSEVSMIKKQPRFLRLQGPRPIRLNVGCRCWEPTPAPDCGDLPTPGPGHCGGKRNLVYEDCARGGFAQDTRFRAHRAPPPSRYRSRVFTVRIQFDIRSNIPGLAAG